jgi:hypothetical protein
LRTQNRESLILMSNSELDTDPLESAATKIIKARGGDVRNALKALIVANEYLVAELKNVRSKVSSGYLRGTITGHTALGCGDDDSAHRGQSLVFGVGERRLDR